MDEIRLTNLLYAALLLNGGARLDRDGVKYSGHRRDATLVLTLDRFDKDRLAAKLEALAQDLRGGITSGDDLAWLLDDTDSLIRQLDMEYRRLKQLVVKGRPR